MNNPEMLSKIRVIAKANSSKFREVVKGLILEGQSAPPEIIDAVRVRIFERGDLDILTLQNFIIRFREKRLYQEYFGVFSLNFNHLVNFLSAGIPDNKIESILCERLMQSFEQEVIYGTSKTIITALRDHGSMRSLDALEMIVHNLKPREKVSAVSLKEVNEQIDRDGKLTSESFEKVLCFAQDVNSLKRLNEAITSIQARGFSGYFDTDKETWAVKQDAYDNIILSDEERILKLINSKKESNLLEFKQTLSWCVRSKQKLPALQDAVLKNVVAFLNSLGGDILIGVDDDGNVIGIENELSNLSMNEDKFELHFKSLLKERIGLIETNYLVDYKIMKVKDVNILSIHCKPSKKAVYLHKKDLYIRSGAAADLIFGADAENYIRGHFLP